MRYAYPPNALGYCGPLDSPDLLDRAGAASGRAQRDERGDMEKLARGFAGAWPYLELIASTAGVGDPLDKSVVEAYFVGNALADRVSLTELGRFVDESFGRGAATSWRGLTPAHELGACAHHNFHVLSVYPWVRLLRSGIVSQPLKVLDQCRIRWGRVTEVAGDSVVVRSEPLAYRDGALLLGEALAETVAWRRDNRSFIGAPSAGDWVTLHWDWVCDVIGAEQVGELAERTARQIRVANAST